MAVITPEAAAAFRERGYAVVPGVLDEAQLARGRELVAAMLRAEPPGPGHAGPYFLWPRFGGDGHALLDFYTGAGIGRLAAGLLRPGLDLEEPDFAQVATTIPPWPTRCSSSGSRRGMKRSSGSAPVRARRAAKPAGRRAPGPRAPSARAGPGS